ncbi:MULTISPECIES: hypothetical protein [Burkholderia cepacia complex]|uniref:hypothetical protein n=1 Tax=Burkholderia cepacia complex TaxID=87882 RepID=UPI0022EABCD7|nr:MULTISPECIES: hypothetical protein [Burkholderia cepacia complex]MDA3672505.1 hypothetical protein [Burkholderia cenocepacia]MDA3681472.1 hypothetical protein [Burkholderia cenocepacia]MDA3689085.1 hypothetical protein [Burkholderia cenocepacia]MDA3696482.1 hypothetical protein [Burkholderia cenocepacia]MDA3703867.1 hypothetical protein [Burkholderia cenocepacia]
MAGLLIIRLLGIFRNERQWPADVNGVAWDSRQVCRYGLAAAELQTENKEALELPDTSAHPQILSTKKALMEAVTPTHMVNEGKTTFRLNTQLAALPK